MKALLTRSLTLAALIAFPAMAVASDANARSVSGNANTSVLPETAQSAEDLAYQRSLFGVIVGVWDSNVTLTNCSTGAVLAQFRGIESFIAGGSLTDTNSMPPTSRGPGSGSWWYTWGYRHFGAQMHFFRYNPDGTLAGTNLVDRDIVVASNWLTYTGTGMAQILDPAGNLLSEACVNEEAQRSN
ncbi:MAG: hypothetical protein WBV61_07885 [Rhodanobacteraceae bacterium]